MARKIDPAAETIIKEYGLKASDVLWDCHGTWCMYHRAIEKIAADQGIKFDPPQVLEADGAGKSVALCVTGRMTGRVNDRVEWSIGEAAPGNNKNSYPYAMAEKRAKDRVVLKLIGLHGLVYSEDEMDQTAPTAAPAPRETITSGPQPQPSEAAREFVEKAGICKTVKALDNYGATIASEIAKLNEREKAWVARVFLARRQKLHAEESSTPLTAG